MFVDLVVMDQVFVWGFDDVNVFFVLVFGYDEIFVLQVWIVEQFLDFFYVMDDFDYLCLVVGQGRMVWQIVGGLFQILVGGVCERGIDEICCVYLCQWFDLVLVVFWF